MSDNQLMLGGMPLNVVFRQVGLLVGIAASVALGIAVVLWSQTPNYGLLYGSLSDRDATEVLETLDNEGIPYRIEQGTGAVTVPVDRVHDARLKLASAGLPKSSSLGFEMLDQKQGFGTSQFIEKARYQRALEGELARSIAKLANIRGARVHLATPKQSVFARERKAPSASVLVDLYPGRVVEAGQIAAISHLVASSVPNLTTSNVTVVDQSGNLLTSPSGNEDLALTVKRFEYKDRVESSLIKRIENILTPMVGNHGVRAQVAVDLDFTETEKTSESYNPEVTAVRSEQLSEEHRIGSTNGGIPGALTNQPPDAASVPELTGDGAAIGEKGEDASPRDTRKNSTRNYELDKTISHTRIAVGSVRRLSVAVVVKNTMSVDAEGQPVSVEYTQAQLNRLTNLVKQVVGFNANRGDSVNVIGSNFVAPQLPEPLPELPFWEQSWFWSVLKQTLGAIFVVLLLVGVLRPVTKSLIAAHEAEKIPALTHEPVTEEPVQEVTEAQLAYKEKLKKLSSSSSLDGGLDTIQSYVSEQPKVTAQIVKNWIGAEDG